MRKSFFLLWTCVLHQIGSNFGTILLIAPATECISVEKFNKAAAILCQNRSNLTLWQHLVDCHVPMSEEYLRKSSAAHCPVPQLVDPNDCSKSTAEVFTNFCTLSAGPSFRNRFQGEYCYVYGGQFGDLHTLSHYRQRILSMELYGEDINCKVGECILKMGLNL